MIQVQVGVLLELWPPTERPLLLLFPFGQMPALENPQHEQFVQSYLRTFSAMGAARAAGFHAQYGMVLLRTPAVQSRLREIQTELKVKFDISADQIMAEAALLAFSDLTALQMDADGRVTVTEGANEELTRTVQSVKIKESSFRAKDGTENTRFERELKLHSKTDALRLLAQMTGALTQKVEVSGPDGGPIETTQSMRFGDTTIEF